MKTKLSGISAAGRALLISCLTICAMLPTRAESLDQARVTKAVNVVSVLPSGGSPVPARIGDSITGATALSTGDRSRAELEFSDGSLVRLGSNSLFGFKSGEREIELTQGSLLLQVPKGRGDTRIKSLPITAAITGTTILLEVPKPRPAANGQAGDAGVVKLIVMEGSLEWALNTNPRKKLKMVAGDMVAFPANARTLPQKVKVDLAKIKSTALLMDAGMGKLPEVANVDREIAAQRRQGAQDPNHPANGFPVKEPKPQKTDDRSRTAPEDKVDIPTRPDR